MKIKVVISVLDAVRSGISKSTGNEWKSQEFVGRYKEEDGTEGTIAISTMNHDVIKVLETCSVGNEVLLDVAFASKARVFTRKDGTEGVIRSTECYVKSIEPLTF